MELSSARGSCPYTPVLGLKLAVHLGCRDDVGDLMEHVRLDHNISCTWSTHRNKFLKILPNICNTSEHRSQYKYESLSVIISFM